MPNLTFDNLRWLNLLWAVLAVAALGLYGLWQRRRTLRSHSGHLAEHARVVVGELPRRRGAARHHDPTAFAVYDMGEVRRAAALGEPDID